MARPVKKTWSIVKLRQYSRRKLRPFYTSVCALAFLLGGAAVVIDSAMPVSMDDDIQLYHSIVKRSTNSTSSDMADSIAGMTDMPKVGNYPKDLFTMKQLRHGAVVLHTAGMIYMFVALAIVCDEFFVPALEVITEKLDLTQDVAGATFMAAGGSAPELFTSVAGVFISQDSVGISTIIGSAVFNILFVIGVCALAAKELLTLTWWPLMRDSCFYSISLVTLIVSYLDWRIYWYEAVILLCCYGAYVTFMVFNSKIEKKVKSVVCKQKAKASAVDLVPVSSITSLVIMVDGGNKMKLCLQDQNRQNQTKPVSSLKFRAGLLQLMIHTIDPLGTGKIEERAMQLRQLGMQQKKLEGKDQNSNTKDMTTGDDKALRLHQPNTNGLSSVHGHSPSANSNGSNLTDIEVVEHDLALTPNGNSSARNGSHQQPADNSTTPAGERKLNKSSSAESAWELSTPDPEEAGGDDDSAPLDLSWPNSHRKRLTYILLAPIIFPLWLTLPDTRRPEKRKYYAVTFLGSIIWIAAFSIMMVWWASTICLAIGMPAETIGMTVLAAGTSVPDLLTSVIVARKGFGDMAISSSIGSNIFDITVGLPVPWLIGSLLKIPNPYVRVDAKGLLCSIMLLFLMLLTTIGSIGCFKWKLSKPLGGCMIVLYFIFLAVSVLLLYDYIPCIDIQV